MSDEPLQFDKVDLAPEAKSRACANCHNALSDTYWEVNGHVVCASCRDALEGRAGLPDETFWQAVAYALAAAVGAAVAYYLAIAKFGGGYLGLLTFGVAWAMGKAIHAATGGRNDQRLQILGVALIVGAIIEGHAVSWMFREEGAFSLMGLLRATTRHYASPVSDGNVLSLFVMALGLFNAWRTLTPVALKVNGPYQLSTRPPEAPSGG